MSQKIISFIEHVYDTHTHPIYLSTLGKKLRDSGFIINGLRATIESLEDFTVVQGKEKERIAIARRSDVLKIQKMLHDVSNQVNKEIITALYNIPRNILYAFCSMKKTPGSFFIERKQPFHYFSTREKEGLLEIPKDLLLDAHVPANIKHIDSDVASELLENIQRWAKANAIDLSGFEKGKEVSVSGGRYSDSLIKKIILAIPASQRHRVSLPLDIIEYLMK